MLQISPTSANLQTHNTLVYSSISLPPEVMRGSNISNCPWRLGIHNVLEDVEDIVDFLI